MCLVIIAMDVADVCAANVVDVHDVDYVLMYMKLM